MIIDKNFEKLFSYWIISLVFLIFTMIIVGGLTRLTGSGLSITEWELFKGILPPLTNERWLEYFALYKEIPQYKLINSGMVLNEFKIIFLWEYFHRLLGRLIGLVYIIPLVYFIYKKVLSKEYILKLSLIFSLILLQGIIGWYMVMSGLVNNITVSHYRLSIHLFVAFIIFSSLLWIYFNLKTKNNKKFFDFNSNFLSLKLFLFLIFSQIIFGAFVSGLDAGKIYQTWPLMNGNYFPNDIIIYNTNDLLNFNNHSLVQFFHRNIAYLIFIVSIYMGYVVISKKMKHLFKSYFILLFFIFLQIVLGISALLSNLSVPIASMHQISSIFLIIVSIRLYHQSIK